MNKLVREEATVRSAKNGSDEIFDGAGHTHTHVCRCKVFVGVDECANACKDRKTID